MTSRIRIRRTGASYLGTIDVGAPDMDARLVISAEGESQAIALTKAALLAERIADDPVLREMLPPQALVAVKAAKMLGKAAQRGLPALRLAWRALRGQGKRRLAAALVKEAADNSAPSEVAGFGSFIRKAANVTLNPMHQARMAARHTRGAARKVRGRPRSQEREERNDVDAEDYDDATSEVGVLPFAMLAAKYGPGVARAAAKAYAKRKAAKAVKRKRASSRRAAPEPAQAREEEPLLHDDEGRDEPAEVVEDVDLGDLASDDDEGDDDEGNDDVGDDERDAR